MHTLGRTLAGTYDLVTFMIPTQSLVHPEYVWNDFGKETTVSTNSADASLACFFRIYLKANPLILTIPFRNID